MEGDGDFAKGVGGAVESAELEQFRSLLLYCNMLIQRLSRYHF